jgi:hypothetical protein
VEVLVLFSPLVVELVADSSAPVLWVEQLALCPRVEQPVP